MRCRPAVSSNGRWARSIRRNRRATCWRLRPPRVRPVSTRCCSATTTRCRPRSRIRFRRCPTVARLLSVTGAMQVGMVLLAPFYEPIVLAEQLGTLAAFAQAPLIVTLANGGRAQAFDAFGMKHEQSRRTAGRTGGGAACAAGRRTREPSRTFHSARWRADQSAAERCRSRSGSPAPSRQPPRAQVRSATAGCRGRTVRMPTLPRSSTSIARPPRKSGRPIARGAAPRHLRRRHRRRRARRSRQGAGRRLSRHRQSGTVSRQRRDGGRSVGAVSRRWASTK